MQAVPWEETTLQWMDYSEYDPATDEPDDTEAEEDVEEKEGDIFIHDDGTPYRLERMTRRDTIDRALSATFDLMEVLAKYCGDENVRLVVWFDD
ncbi:MAG TPA: hypothetical protein VKU00_07975 [Chthonomonadaceae bacterium]|nr:hypothetical protein [Chthonomonadaceae bacterium]